MHRPNSRVPIHVPVAAVAIVFIAANLANNGFPFQHAQWTEDRMFIGLPRGMSYEQWYFQEYGKVAPGRQLVIDREALAWNCLVGMNLAIVTAFITLLYRRTSRVDLFTLAPATLSPSAITSSQ